MKNPHSKDALKRERLILRLTLLFIQLQENN